MNSLNLDETRGAIMVLRAVLEELEKLEKHLEEEEE